MSFFHPQIPIKQKEHSCHPWEKRIKDVYMTTYKYGHNSANNLKYPLKKAKISNKERITFTVIGNRLTKEFIYCVYLLKGLHKYRQKEFKAPIFRGVTSVDWPKVWNDLKIQYGGISHCLQSEVAILMDNKFLGGIDELKALIESKYTYYFRLDYHKEGIQQFGNFIKFSGRPCAYLQISIDEVPIGTLIFMLYADIVPLTCENFLRLCETRKGGYGGTPIHRIVEDCWFQGGGFGLKSSNLRCENYIVQHDRRGVLCMANNGRNVDCSTQFFVLLQPAPWMTHKYVAFGQLIEGEKTLEKIEKVQTWYESPLSKIVIYKAGVFNMECHDIPINKSTHEYLHAHVEDLFTLGKLFYEELLERAFTTIENRKNVKEEVLEEDNNPKNLRPTQRFMRKKEEIQVEAPDAVANSDSDDNKEFDVDVYDYEYEFEAYTYSKQITVSSVIVEPVKPFYLPFTDVPYPGEVDSTYDLKKLLKGDYCLESDLEKDRSKRQRKSLNESIDLPTSTVRIALFEENAEDDESDISLDSTDMNEITDYLQENADKVSFSGRTIRKIADMGKKYEILKRTEDKNYISSKLLSDEELRIHRMATKEYKASRDKKVAISISPDIKESIPTKIKRRQTGPLKIKDGYQDEVFSRVNRTYDEHYSAHRTSDPTSYAPPRHSILSRLYDDVRDFDEDGPTLKCYKPFSETQPKKFLLTHSPTQMVSNDAFKNKHRRSSHPEEHIIDQVLCLQHGNRVSRKISSDYVRTIDHIENNINTTMRSMEYAKKRPSISVAQYQMRNKLYKQEMEAAQAAYEDEIED